MTHECYHFANPYLGVGGCVGINHFKLYSGLERNAVSYIQAELDGLDIKNSAIYTLIML